MATTMLGRIHRRRSRICRARGMTGCRVLQRPRGLRGARLAMLLGAAPAFLLDAGAALAQRAAPPTADSTDSFLLADASPPPPPFAGTILPAVGVTPSTGPDF